MQFHNKIQNREEEMSGIQRGTIKDPTDWEKKQMNMFGPDKIQELKDKVQEIRKPEVPVIPYESQVEFWGYLTDVQIGKFDPEALTKANTWVITRNGTWLVQKSSGGYYAVRKSDKGIPTLPATKELPNAFFDLANGKIPNAILQQIIAFFREIMKRYNDAEAFVQVYWDKQENKYICHVPKQRISKGSVNYDATENLDSVSPERYTFVYECHSHNSMGAFWSGTDNRDEKELRVYGVFGQLDKDAYANKHRFFVGEEQVDVDLSLVFDMPEANEEEKRYAITHNNQQYMVSGKQLILDEKPKYILEHNGQKFYVPLESVVPVKEPAAKVEYPETWFKVINVPSPSYDRTTPTTNLHPSLRGSMPGRNWDGGGHTMPSFPKKGKSEASDPFHFNETQGHELEEMEETVEEEGLDPDYELMAYEVQQAAREILFITNDFEDPEATFAFLSAIEQDHALRAMEKAINGYYLRSRQFDEGPSDGRY